MKKLRFAKKLMCFVLVSVVTFVVSIPAYAVDWDFMDNHGEEGKELWEAYKNEVINLDIEHNQKAIDRLNQCSERFHAKCYEDTMGKSQEEYNNLSPTDKLLLASTFLEPHYMSSLGQTYNNDMAWSNATERFNLFYASYYRENESIKLLYHNLMYWQYQYYQSSGAFYNFMEEKDTFDYINDKYLEEVHKESNDDVESKIISSVSSTTSTESKIAKNEKGLWEGVLDGIRSHMFTIILLCVFLVATVVILIRKKRVNMQDDNKNI